MATRTLQRVPNDQVDRVVASFEKIGWTCEVTPDGGGTSTIVATSPDGTVTETFSASDHMVAAADLAAQASAHAELAGFQFDQDAG